MSGIVLEPLATIGILGGGQLGRMLALAAARLGFKCHVFSPSPDSPAFDVVQRVSCADYSNTEALDRFAADVDVVTYEFENVPAETATFLAARVPVLPDPKILATTQDRLVEKTFVGSLGIPTAPFAAVDGPAELTAAIERIGKLSDVTEFYDLWNLLNDPHQELREAAARLFARRGGKCGPSHSAAGRPVARRSGRP